MSTRKCIYTNKDAKYTDNIIPRGVLGPGEIHNWCNKAPIGKEHREVKNPIDMPTELEIEANDVFHKLELARIKVKFYQEKLIEIQKQIGQGMVKFTATDSWYKEQAKQEEGEEGVCVYPMTGIDNGPKKPSKRASKRMKKEVIIAKHEVEEIQEAEVEIKKSLKKKDKGFAW